MLSVFVGRASPRAAASCLPTASNNGHVLNGEGWTSDGVSVGDVGAGGPRVCPAGPGGAAPRWGAAV